MGKCIVSVFQIVLINGCMAEHLVIVACEDRGASEHLGICCRRTLMVMPPDTDNSFAHNLHFTSDALPISKLSHNLTDLHDLPFYFTPDKCTRLTGCKSIISKLLIDQMSRLSIMKH